MGLKIRTDLALEAKESLDEDGSLNGVVFDEQTDGSTGIKVSRLRVLNETGERSMGAQRGYITPLRRFHCPRMMGNTTGRCQNFLPDISGRL